MPESKEEILRKVRDLLSDPARWTKGWFAKDSSENPCVPTSKDAVCWCALGAMRKQLGYVEDDLFMEITRDLEAILKKQGYNHSLATFNDDPATTHNQMMKLLNLAIGEDE